VGSKRGSDGRDKKCIKNVAGKPAGKRHIRQLKDNIRRRRQRKAVLTVANVMTVFRSVVLNLASVSEVLATSTGLIMETVNASETSIKFCMTIRK
jgi:hypothetical protein